MMTTDNPNTAFKTTNNTHHHNHTILHHIGRRLLLLTTLLAMVVGVKAQTEQYVIYYQDGETRYYMSNVGGTLTSTTTYVAATCIWEGTSGSTFSNNGKSIDFTSGYNAENSVLLTNATSQNIKTLTIDSEGYIYYDSPHSTPHYYIYYKDKNQSDTDFYNSISEEHYGNTRVKAEVAEDTPPTVPDDNLLVEAKNNAKNTLTNKTPGAAVCQYTYTVNGQPATEASLIETAIDNATTIEEVNTITASASINLPVVGKYYRIKGYVSKNYIDAVNRYNNSLQMGMKPSGEYSKLGTVFYLDEGNRLLNLGTGTYVYETRAIGATKENANIWTFAESTRTPGCITLQSNATGGAGQHLHDNEGNRADRCSYDCGIRHDFVLEEVILDTPEPRFIISKDLRSFTLSCTENEGTIYYTEDGSDPTIAISNRKKLTEGQGITFSATSGLTVKAYAHKEGYGPSAVVTQVMNVSTIGTAEEFAAITGSGIYIITADIKVTSHTSITNFTGVLDGGFHTISGLTSPLFATTSGATIKNVVLDKVNITGGTGNVGAIAGTASGATRIYNCGVLSGSIGGGTNVGSIAGSLNDEARVINCYSFANITGGTTVGGIVGYNSVASTTSNLKTLVMNCMFYGDITGGTSVSPIYGGQKISNAGANGINNYNYYRYEAKITPTVYNCALAAEERYLTRFEFYRHVLNSQRKLCAFYVTGDVNDYAEIAKWVLDVSDPKAPQYPILKPWGKYASMMNRAATNKSGNKLTVKISGENATEEEISATTTLDITNADPETHDYNHYKVQLPYYNDHFTDNYTNNKVVTGWKITSITEGTAGTFSKEGNNRYNFADRHCTQKDLYSVSGRVFAQGGFFNVPEGVTAITIEPYWGKAVYLSDAAYDVVYTTGYAGKFFQPAGLGETLSQFNGQTVHKSMSNVWANLQSGVTVFDNAIVLVGNYHSYNETWENSSGGKPFTIMSVDLDKDNEPDYSLYFKTSVRVWINPVRFDFINHVALGMAAKVDENNTMPNIAIFRPKGWFEITETALAIYEEFEYDWYDTGKTLAPLILNGGIFNQFCSLYEDASTVFTANRTQYVIVGGNCYFKDYTPGCQNGEISATAFPPVSILGGEYENFYLSGLQAQVTPVKGHNALCYGNGGKIGMFAGACQEAIDGDVIIKLDHMFIDEFYGGGVNDKKPITGNINVTINNSQVGIYCGGPKFGNMAEGKTITTYAENTTFGRSDETISGRFFGAGYGGTSLYRNKPEDQQNQTDYPTSWFNTYYTSNRGKYYNTDGDDRGILVSYETEHFCYAGGGNVNARFYTKYASLSVAEVKNVTSTLKGCTINGDLYGGGNLGKASGNISTTLENCIVKGSAYAAGFSAAAPTCEVMPTTPPSYSTYNGNTGIFTPVKYPQPEIFTWAQADAALGHGNKYIDDTKKLIYTKAVDLSDLGTVRGNDTIKIKGNSHIHGSVFGGGNSSKVIGNTHVHIQGGTIDGNVFGAGNQAEVTGKTEVVIGGECKLISNAK